MFEEIENKRAFGLPRKITNRVIESAVAEALWRCYGIPNVVADMETRRVHFLLDLPGNAGLVKIFSGSDGTRIGHSVVQIIADPKSLPGKVKKTAIGLINDRLKQIGGNYAYERELARENRLAEGVICGRNAGCIKVRLNDTVALFEKRHWVKREIPLYDVGKMFLFFVLKVVNTKNGVTVFLSRRSVRLPALLLKSHLPTHRFVCGRRYAGHKCWISTDAPLTSSVTTKARESVRRELNGEILEMKNFD